MVRWAVGVTGGGGVTVEATTEKAISFEMTGALPTLAYSIQLPICAELKVPEPVQLPEASVVAGSEGLKDI